MINQEISKIFNKIAELLELKKVQWKPRAYKRAAQAINNLPTSLKEIYKKQGLKGLDKIPGVGIGLSKKIEEYIKTKKLKEYERLKNSKVKVKTYSLQEILPIANEIKNNLKKLKEIKQIEIAGSIRRKQPQIKDIDIIATSKNTKKVIDKFISLKQVKKVLAKGSTKAMVMYNNIQCDLRVVPEESYSATLQYFTGDKQHNITLRKIAKNKGLKLSEYGITGKNKKFITKTEAQVYKILGFKLIPPIERINKKEFDKYKITR